MSTNAGTRGLLMCQVQQVWGMARTWRIGYFELTTVRDRRYNRVAICLSTAVLALSSYCVLRSSKDGSHHVGCTGTQNVEGSRQNEGKSAEHPCRQTWGVPVSCPAALAVKRLCGPRAPAKNPVETVVSHRKGRRSG